MLPAIRKRLAGDPDVLVFSASDSLGALEAIRRHRPKIAALDAAFAATARGAALVADMKRDPVLNAVDLRVLTEDETRLPVVLDQRMTSAEAVLRAGARLLDHCGTRQVVRARINGSVEVSVNGECCDLVDLSVTGAQISAPMRLRPDESVRLAFADESAETRCHGVVAWVVARNRERAVPRGPAIP